MKSWPKTGIKKDWHSQSGGAISEFLIAAPILLLLLYVVFDLNDRIELRQDLRIAARNVSHQGTVAIDHIALSKDFKKVQLEITPTAISIENKKVNQDRVEANLDSGKLSSDSYEQVSSFMGPVIYNGANILNEVKSFSVLGESLLIPDLPRTFTVSIKSSAESSVQKGMRYLSNLFAKKADDIIGESTFLFDHVAMASVRNESGYHSSDYRNQALVGMFLGNADDDLKHWGDPHVRENRYFQRSMDGYQPDCMMHFQGNSKCKIGNVFATTLRVVYMVVGVVKEYFSGGGASSSSAATDLAADGALDVVTEEAFGVVKDEVEEKATTELNKIFDKELGVEKKIKTQLGNVGNSLNENITEKLSSKGKFSDE